MGVYEDDENIRGKKQISNDVKPNYAYFPAVFDEKVFGASRNEVFEALAKEEIRASYIRLYPKKWFENPKLWIGLASISLVMSWLSVVILAYIGKNFDKTGIAYFEVADSNKILAVTTAISLFMLFKNLKIKQQLSVIM